MDTNLRILKCLDGLNYSFELLNFYYSDLYSSCIEINDDQRKCIKALALCWGFVDTLHRIREIAQALPGISSKEPEMRFFLTATHLAEAYRHYIQHLRGELSKKSPNPFPVWGSLAWVDRNDSMRSYLVIIGTQIPGTSYTGCVFDTVNLKWVSKVCLGINEHSFNFDPIYESCLRFKKFIIPWIESYSNHTVTITNRLPIITVSINLMGNVQQGTPADAAEPRS